MAKKKKSRFLGMGIGVIAAIALLAFALVGLPALAVSESDSGGEVGIEGNVEGREGEVTVAASAVTNSINYQGRLTVSAGKPLSGTYSMTFRLYEVASGGTVLDTDTHTVEVTEGLFNTNINFDPSYFDGGELWLGIKVGADAEMTPRQELRPVPYALSLRPGAIIDGALPGYILEVKNAYIGGKGVLVETFFDYSEGVLIATSGDYSKGVDSYTYGDGSSGIYSSTSGVSSCGICGVTTGNLSPGIGACTIGYSSDGVNSQTTGDVSHGVRSYTSGNDSNGVYAYADGDSSHGVYAYSSEDDAIFAKTGRADHEYGVRTPDKIWAMSYDTSSSDVAEYFAVDVDVEAGAVVVIGEDGRLQCSTTAYDTRVAGIVSTSPGMSLGVKEEGNEGEKLIAVAGRVPCKVDATYAPIEPGDLLTTSETPGYAMKATNPKVGTILCKALEPLDSGTGVIEVLVTLQ